MGRRKRRTFTREYKAEVVGLVRTSSGKRLFLVAVIDLFGRSSVGLSVIILMGWSTLKSLKPLEEAQRCYLHHHESVSR